MRRAEVEYQNEVNEILANAIEATVYMDNNSGKYIVEYFPKNA